MVPLDATGALHGSGMPSGQICEVCVNRHFIVVTRRTVELPREDNVTSAGNITVWWTSQTVTKWQMHRVSHFH